MRYQNVGKKAKLVDLARAAGVSVSTVSRVATGSARVSPEVTDRIRRAAQRLGADFRKSKVIAFLLSNRNVLHPFHSHILLGAELHSAASGWNMLFMTFRYSPNVVWPEL